MTRLVRALFSEMPSTILFGKRENLEVYAFSRPDFFPRLKLTSPSSILVRKTFANAGFGVIRSDSDARWLSLWGIPKRLGEYSDMNAMQRVSHFPSTYEVGRKDRLAWNLQRLTKKVGSWAYSFFPHTFVLPRDSYLLKQHLTSAASHRFIARLTSSQTNNSNQQSQTNLINESIPYYSQLQNTEREQEFYISKPVSSARGIGVHLVSNPLQLPQDTKAIIQRYISHPLLVNGYKIDIRIYIAVTGVNPFRIYMFPQGLVRFASEEYIPLKHKRGGSKGSIGKIKKKKNKQNNNQQEEQKQSQSEDMNESEDENDSKSISSQKPDSPSLTSQSPQQSSSNPISQSIRFCHLTNFSINKKRKSEWNKPGNEWMIPAKQAWIRRRMNIRRKRKSKQDQKQNNDPNINTDKMKAELQNFSQKPISQQQSFSQQRQKYINSFYPPLPIGDSDGDGTKWTLTELRLFIRYILGADDTLVIHRIQDVIIKALLSASQPFSATSYALHQYAQNGWELFGADILLDENLRPWILEINTSPSLQASSRFDLILLKE
ncbi:MAG: putative tubulin polyglutamylase TTLL4 [Streblomastix strix]|uniref:Tubulin--tyrosine ligase-like protein 5 n=1 Tax=Streblomastix strix TaxID=222440 RepID=A0A5J4X6Y5_9EUKA|nr:MAG: putative tubulin polyglutamylase TTLL4 [Streblomastix strix]